VALPHLKDETNAGSTAGRAGCRPCRSALVEVTSGSFRPPLLRGTAQEEQHARKNEFRSKGKEYSSMQRAQPDGETRTQRRRKATDMYVKVQKANALQSPP